MSDKGQKTKKPVKAAAEKKANPRKSKPTDETGRELKVKSHSAIYSITIAVMYITIILIISAALSFFILSVGNDVFALKKTERTAEIDLGAYPTVIDVSNEMKKKGITRTVMIVMFIVTLFNSCTKENDEKMGKPSFLMVLTGGEFAYQRKDGVLVVPIGCLKD